MKWFFFYDRNFRPLRDNMVSSLQDQFEVCEDYIEDLKVLKGRAGGGIPTYLYKAQKIKDALESVAEGEVVLFTDVDIQFFAPIQAVVEESINDLDLVLQREFEDIGVNIGVIAMRNVSSTRAFWSHVHEEISRTQALDQRVVNNALYSELAMLEFGLTWGRFPMKLWASSMAGSGVLPDEMLLHHANFTIERSTSFDPSVKLGQMANVRSYVQGSPKDLLEWVAAVQADPSLADYRDRHFGARRPGPEWTALPIGHIARPGGFREKKTKKVDEVTCRVCDGSGLLLQDECPLCEGNGKLSA